MKKQRKKKVLDKGFVILLDYMASDQDGVEAARVSTGTKSDPEKDKKLIDFLMAHHHETPFEHLVFRFHIKCPFFVARQWMRHRISSYNEVSARYRKVTDQYYIPKLKDVPSVYKQKDLELYEKALKTSYDVYSSLLEKTNKSKEQRGRAREVFRGLLGTAYYTEFYWTINFRSLMNFLTLRTHRGAQYEIRQYAFAIRDMIKDIIPLTYQAYIKHIS